MNITSAEAAALRAKRPKMFVCMDEAKHGCDRSVMIAAKQTGGSIEVLANLVLSKSTDEAKLNKTESRYLAVLRAMRYPWLGIQAVTLKLADDTRLTPDFEFINSYGGMTFVDVKGFQREDALIKMKVAARLFPWATFQIVSLVKGEWQVREIKP